MEREDFGRRCDFRPILRGCVRTDRAMAHALEKIYQSAFCAVSDHILRSLICEPLDAELAAVFDRLATERLLALRRIGALIEALGGSPCLRGRIGRSIREERYGDATLTRAALLGGAVEQMRSERHSLCRLASLTEDNLVSAVLEWLIADLEEQEGRLTAFQE